MSVSYDRNLWCLTGLFVSSRFHQEVLSILTSTLLYVCVCIRSKYFKIATDRPIPGVPKKYTSLKPYIFVLRTHKTLNCMSSVRQDLNLNFET